jgi:protoporphyrinogen oxidase
VRIAVIGAGVAGLAAAHRLGASGHVCHVYERWPGLGGQAATLDVGDGVLLERYYHHLFISDRHIADLYAELGLDDELEWRASRVGLFRDGRIHRFTSPLDLLRFAPLSLRARVRMGAAILLLQRRHPRVEPFEGQRALEWVQRHMGREVADKVWGPLLRAKFGESAEDLSMAWLWSKFTVRRQIKGKQARQELLGYPRTTFESLFKRLAESIEQAGGDVFIDRPAARIARENGQFVLTPGVAGSFRRGHDPRAFEPDGESARYDAVLATVPSDVFEQLLEPGLATQLEPGYMDRLRSIEYHSALCMLLELDRPFSSFYWTNIADPEIPFIGLIEQTNLVEPSRYGGRRFLYVANYKAHGHPLLELGADELLDAYEPGLRKINPGFSREWIKQRWLFKEPAAQPIVTVGYHERMPPLRTGVPGLILANTTQVYPEDRGTNYAVRLGDQAAAAVRADLDTATSGVGG